MESIDKEAAQSNRVTIILVLIALWIVFLAMFPDTQLAKVWDRVTENLPNLSVSSSSNTEVGGIIDEFNTAITLNPRYRAAYGQLADAYKLVGDLNKIEDVWQRAIDANSDAKWSYEALATHFHTLHRLDEELATWESAIDANPTKSWPYAELVKVYRQQEDWLQEERVWYTAIRNNLNDTWPHYRLASYYKRTEQNTNALSAYRAVSRQFPINADAHYQLATYLFQQKRMDEAIVAYQYAITIDSDNHLYYMHLGRAFLQNRNHAEGITSLEEAISASFTDDTFAFVLAQYKSLPTDMQLESLKRIVTKYPEQPLAHRYLGKAYLDIGRCDKSTQSMATFAKLADTFDSMMELANTFEVCDMADDAQQTHIAATQKFPLRSQGFLSLSEHYVKYGHFKDGFAALVTALQLEPTNERHQQANELLGQYLETEEMLAAMHSLLNDTQSTSRLAYNQLAAQYLSIGQTEQTISVYHTSIVHNPDRFWAHLDLASFYLDLDDWGNALSAYQKAVDADSSFTVLIPQNFRHILLSGRIQSAAGQYTVGGTTLLNALTLVPSKAAYRDVRRAYHTYFPDEIAQTFQEKAALIRWPEPISAYRNLASWYATQGNPKTSIRFYQKLLDESPQDLKTIRSLIPLHQELGDCSGALDYSTQSVNISQSSVDALTLAATLSDCGFDAQAEAAHRKALTYLISEESNRKKKRNILSLAQTRYANGLSANRILKIVTNIIQSEQFDSPFPYIQIGQYHEEQAQVRDALKTYTNGLAYHPQNPALQLSIGRLLLEQADPTAALPHLQKAASLNGENVAARLYVGRSLLAVEQIDQGLSALDSAFNLEPAEWTADYTVQSYIQYLEPQHALPLSLENLSQVNVKESYPYENAIRALAEQGELDSAFAIANQAVDEYPEQVWPSVEMARLLRRAGKMELAEKLLRDQVEAHPANAVAHLELGFTLGALEQEQESLIELQIAASLDRKQGWLQLYWGQALLNAERFSESLDAFQVGLTRETTEPAFAFVDDILTQNVPATDILNFYVELLGQRPTESLVQQYYKQWRDTVLSNDDGSTPSDASSPGDSSSRDSESGPSEALPTSTP